MNTLNNLWTLFVFSWTCWACKQLITIRASFPSGSCKSLRFSARANSTFESERAKLLAEVTELTGSKRRLDDVRTVANHLRQRT